MSESLITQLVRRAVHQPEQTAYTFLENGEQPGDSLTYGQLDLRARAVAAALRETLLPRDRVLLAYPPGLEFIVAFFGCLYADVIAVPAYPPHPSRPSRCVPRLQAIARNAGIRAILCPAAMLDRWSNLSREVPEFVNCSLLATDQVDTAAGHDWRPSQPDRESIAFLQFTSGSTATPKGVMISHRNIMHNLAYLAESTHGDAQTVQVSWLPTYHDMGLFAGVLYPLYLGCPSYLMSPVAFLQRPVRWLAAISRYRGTNSGGPNFAYELCADRIPAEDRAELDLSTWRIAFSGAEPIRRDALERFWRAYQSVGFRWDAFRSAYGLAESTVFVSGGPLGDAPDAAPDGPVQTRRPISCGKPGSGTEVRIVDPEHHTERAEGEEGEIWIRSPSVAHGYWNRESESRHAFQARLADSSEGPFLRTGDLGHIWDEQLFVTGRLKDLIIIRGRKVYPQDIERTVESSHELVLPNATAAIAVPTDEGERLFIVAEVNRRRSVDDRRSPPRHSHGDSLENLIGAIRQVVAEQHEVQTFGVSLIARGSIPKTSSGKIQRHACIQALLAGGLDTVLEWTLQPLVSPAKSPPICEPTYP